MLLYPTKPSRRGKWCYCTLQNRRGDQIDAIVPYKIAIREENGAIVPYKITTERKMVLLYPTKSPRREKWCYCTLQNHHGDQIDATERLKNTAEAKMVLLSGSKRPGRPKWCY